MSAAPLGSTVRSSATDFWSGLSAARDVRAAFAGDSLLVERVPRPQSRTALVASVAFAIVLAAAGTVGWRWYHYVTAGASPYDEVGIEVNRHLPQPLREWGCARIKERFPRALPPYGCQPGQV